ncbi:MAG: M23 family metallopeptidase [Gemmatimonadales bacterium]
MTGATAATWCALLATACGGSDSIGPGDGPDLQTVRCTQEFGDPAASPYQLPFQPGTSRRLIQGYCPSNPNWGHHGWLAYDFDLAIGDTILASRAGNVGFVEQSWPDADRICGHENSVWIVHDDGTVMSYVHLTPGGALVELGDRVAAGEPIGLSGDSGCSSGPHLHVAMFADRSSFDKENTLPLNYHDADGPLDARHGLVQDASYAVLVP